ncbi:MAG: TonB-dependent receptor [Bacteroidetes bacterium]|nr:TonB-dependent receptor [Bacteroidota bacterium]
MTKYWAAKKFFLLTLFTFIALTSVFAQGILRGKITDENGEAMISATVVLKSNSTIGTVTDLDGNFSLTLPDTSAQTIVVSVLGYKKIEELVRPKKGEVVLHNFSMQPAATEIKEVVISAKAVRANDIYLDNVKRKSATTLDYISSETMKKTGDANVVAAIARVPGVSTNGGFITVRGIGDRYVKTGINGCRIPTLDPFTNNIKLDLLPTNLIDNILITKTTSPDLPGDWAGAYISVETKDYPDKLAVNLELTSEFNFQSTFRNIVSSEHSKTDWLGYDNGFREHNHAVFVTPIPNPNQYEEFVGLGMGDYYRSLGITQPWVSGTASGDALFKLGLVELGLLPKAMFNDPVAFQSAKIQYLNGTYRSDALKSLSSEAAKSGQSFANNWNTTKRFALPNFGLSFTLGNQVNLFKRPLGFLVGVRYSSNTQYDPNSIAARENAYRDSTGTAVAQVTSISHQKFSRETYAWSALINLAYKFTPNNSITLLFMPNFIGVNNVRDAVDSAGGEFNIFTKSQFYEHRRQMIYQLKTEHLVPGPNVRIELNASYTMGKSNAPDFKNLNYSQDQNTLQYQIGGGGESNIQRYYRYLTDDLLDSRLSVEVPLGNKPGLVRKLKLGGAYQYNKKKSDQYAYDLYLHQDHQVLADDNIQGFFGLDNFGISTATYQGVPYSKMNAWYQENSDPANHTFGYSHIGGGYAMLDFAVLPAFRINGGLRVEYAKIFTDVFLYDSLHYPADDIRRTSFAVLPNPGSLKEINYLPSINFICKLRKDELNPINLRWSYSYGVARPSIRELSETLVYDYEFKSKVFGNSHLKTVKIHNVDLRLESYFKGGHDFSVSFFYKDFTNHIELVNYEFYTWQNVDHSRVLGVELEGKVTLVKGLELRANAAYINSQTKVVEYRIGNGIQDKIPVDTITRTMFGQAPYVVNAILSYTNEKIGLTTTLSYNTQGPRLVIAGISTGGRPDVYERTRHLLDFKISKTLGKYFSISLTARNLLNSPVRRSFKYDEKWLLDFDNFKYGNSLSLGIAFKL